MNRLCAAARRNGSCALVLIFFGLAFAAFSVRKAVAQDSAADEVSIGTFTLSSPQGDARSNGPGSTGGDSSEMRRDASRAPQISDDGRTRELFEDALAALNGGRSEAAQRLFERLIAESPDSALAREARGHLAELYRFPSRSTLAEQGPGPKDGVAVRSEADSPRFGGSDAAVGREQSQGTDVSAAIEEQFIAEAGDRVFFSEGSAELGGRARGVLQSQARFIKLRPDLSAMIEGHADDGSLSADEHARLSEARAEAVRRRLIEEGIESSRLAVTSWGRDKRVSDCPQPACAAQNRRAVTVLVSTRARRMGGPASVMPGAATVVAREPALLTH
jgi:peptidoglycan-associated lipoprotein